MGKGKLGRAPSQRRIEHQCANVLESANNRRMGATGAICTLREEKRCLGRPSDAHSIVLRGAEEIALVLTDVEMGPISGFEFVKRLGHKGIDIPTLFMSGQFQPGESDYDFPGRAFRH
jgi:CheY-like chemotaxis protein